MNDASNYTLNMEAPVSLTVLLTKYKLTLCHNPGNRTVTHKVLQNERLSI